MTPQDLESLSHAFDLFYWFGVLTGFFVFTTMNGLIGLVRTYRVFPSLHRWRSS